MLKQFRCENHIRLLHQVALYSCKSRNIIKIICFKIANSYPILSIKHPFHRYFPIKAKNIDISGRLIVNTKQNKKTTLVTEISATRVVFLKMGF